MSYRRIKLELFYFKKAFCQYKKGFKYLYNRYFLAKKILKYKDILEKPVNNDDLSIHVLTSHRDLVILIWALASFYQVTEIIGQLFIHSDGSLTNKDKSLIEKFFPTAIIINPKDFLEKYLSDLDNYPIIKRFRTRYPEFFLLKKLIDPYFVSDKIWHWIIDSDLFWYKKSEIIEKEIISKGPSKSFMMVGRKGVGEPNYVYFIDGTKLNDKLVNLNSGIVFYAKENFDLERLSEYLEKIDIKNSKNKHFIEQAGYAYCLKELIGLPPEHYQIKEKVTENTVVRHYTNPKRPLLFIEGIDLLKIKILH